MYSSTQALIERMRQRPVKEDVGLDFAIVLLRFYLSPLSVGWNVRNQSFLEGHDLGFSWSLSDVHQQAVDTQHPDERVVFHATRHRPIRVKAPYLEQVTDHLR